MSGKTTVIAVANNKGGTGKTSSACNLAFGLSRKLMGKDGKPKGAVLLVDLDPQGNVSDFFAVRPLVYDQDGNPEGRCVSFCLFDQTPIKQMIVPIMREGKATNLYVLPTSRRLEAITMLLLRDENNRIQDMKTAGFSRYKPLDEILADTLEPGMGVFQYIVLDCPPKLDAFKRAVYHFADHVIVPTKAEYVSVAGTIEHTEDLGRLIDENPTRYKARILYVLPTMVRDNQVADREMRQALVDTYGSERIAQYIPDSVKVKESPGAGGLSVFEYDPSSAPSKAYAALVNGVYARVRL
jgi:chromosome partitioning protein